MAFDLGSIFASVGVDISNLDKGLMQAQVKLAAADKSISGFGQKLTAQSTKMMVAGGLMVGAVAGVAIAAVKMSADFEKSMRNVNSISKQSEEAFAAQSKEVVNLSKTLPQSAKVLADGLYDIASSGFQGADGMKVLTAAAQAASAGLTTTAVSAKGITAVLNAYGLEAEDAAGVSDTMFKTVDRGVISFEELSSTVGDWVGMAKAANISFNEASGAIAYMTTKGIGAAEAGTSLQRMLTGIIKPSEDMAKFIKNAGYESGEMMLKTLGLTGTMKLLNDETGGSITKLINLIPEIRGVRGANALLGSGYEDLTKFMGDFNNTAGATDIALKEQSKSLSFQLDILKNNATAMGIELGNKLIPPIADLVKKLNELSPETKDNIYNFAEMTLKVIAAGGSVLLLTGAFAKLAMIIKANPIGAIVAGMLAVGTAIDVGAGKLDEMNTKWSEFGAESLRALNPLPWQAVGNAVTNLSDIVSVYQGLAKGTIDITDLQNLGMAGAADKLKALTAGKEADNNATVNLANSTFNYTDALAASTTTMDANITTVEESTGANKEETKSIDDMRGAYNELIGVLFDSINTSNAFQEAGWALKDAEDAVTEAIKKYGIGSREAETAVNALDAASQTYIDTAYGVYTAVDATKQEQEEARKKAIEYGLQLVESGKWGMDSFISMASQFGMSSDQIIAYADSMGITLDEVTRARIINISVDASQAVQQVRDLQDLINDMHGTSVTIETIYKTSRMLAGNMAMGGIVGMASGGVVMPQAAAGMVVPQTGRAIPILAHEGEMIFNDSQQGNLIQALWGVANGKNTVSKSSSNEVILHNVINLDGKVLWESNEKYDIRAAGVRV